MNRPVFYMQERVGLNGHLFRLIKFRTMVSRSDIAIQLTLATDPRISKVGKVLRKSKLDELPQLFNVLKGEMSIVGPRPEVPYYFNMYGPAEKGIVAIRPGITDMASIHFRNEEEILARQNEPESYYIKVLIPAKFKLNKVFLENQDLITYLKIILLTISCIYYDPTKFD